METNFTGSADLSHVRLGTRIPITSPYPLILGLLGPQGVGKTTLADAVVERVGGVRLSFAEPIRQMLVALGVERTQFSHHKHLPIPWLHNKTPRDLLRSLGTEWGRELVGPDIWVGAVLRQARQQQKPVIIDDVRFANEAKLLQDAGAMLALVVRPGVTFTYEHPSDCGLRDWSRLNFLVHSRNAAVLAASAHPELLPRRPWWAATCWLARATRRFRAPAAPSTDLATPARTASALVSAWGAAR